jgi:hypothetical protein
MFDIPISTNQTPQNNSETILAILQRNKVTSLSPPPILHTENGKHMSLDTGIDYRRPQHSHLSSQQPPQLPQPPFIPSLIPIYVNKYPQIIDAVSVTSDIISEWQEETLQGKYELECRFGKWTGQYFKNGVSSQFVEKVLSMFDVFNEWSDVTQWEETHDYYYHANHASTNEPQIRSTVKFAIDSKTGKKSIQTEHIRKHFKKKIDLRYIQQQQQQQPQQHRSPHILLNQDSEVGIHSRFDDRCSVGYDLRLSLNYEEKIPSQMLPSVINPTSVRIKSRKSYYYKSQDFPSSDPIWRFDITRSWLGNTKSEAEMKQKNGDTTYELELECLNPKAVMVSPKHDAFYVSCSMLLKMRDLIMCDTFKWEPIK